MQSSRIQELIEQARRRPLTDAELAQLSAGLADHLEARVALAEEAALTRLLAGLSDAPLPPDFRERVLRAVERDETPAIRARQGRFWLRWRPLWRPVALAVALGGLVGLWQVRHHHRISNDRLAESVAVVSGLAADLPGVEVLTDFDLILNLPEGPLPDVVELARALE